MDVVPEVLGGGDLTTRISGSTVLVFVATWLIESALFGGAIARINAVSTGTTLNFEQALRIGIRAALAIFIGDLLSGIATAIGLVFFIVPGLIVGTTLAFFAYAVVLDRKNVIGALEYSHALAWPSWWRTSIVLSVPAIVWIIYLAISIWPDLMSALRQLSTEQAYSALSLVNPWYDYGLMPIVRGTVWSYSISVCYVQYRNLKARAAVH